MTTNMRILSKECLSWYHRLASGGAGLVIVESTPLSLFFSDGTNPPRLTADTLAPLASVIHEGGAKAVIQIFPTLKNIDPHASPASIPEKMLVELTVKFGEVARVCRAAGFDGIEAYGAHGFTLSQFSCRISNTRKDRYGTSLPTLAQEIVASMKAACPDPGFLVMFRHTIPDPTHVECFQDSVALLNALEQQGLDLFVLSPSGTYQTPGCYARELINKCRELGRQNRVPIIGDSGFNDPAKARTAIQEGIVQFVAVGRGHISDTNWARKVIEHRDKEIIKCSRCNIGCHQNLRGGVPINCVHTKDACSRGIIDLENLSTTMVDAKE